MAEYWVNSEKGSDSNPGTEALPWASLPGITGANAVTSGDIINVKTGTRYAGRFSAPTSNLTYRGYGLADNVLVLTLPARNPTQTRQVRVVRQPGVHEGLWILDGTGVDLDGVLQYGSTNNVTIEDVQVIGSQVGTRNAVGMGFSSSNNTGHTLRRFEIVGAAGRGILVYSKGATVEWGRVNASLDDNIQVTATLANGSRAGSTDTFRYLDLRHPNHKYPGGPDEGTVGDNFQAIAYEGGGLYAFESGLNMHDIYAVKNSNAKQLFLFHDATGGMVVRRFHAVGTGDKVVLIGPLRGSLLIEDFYIDTPCPNPSESLPTFRWNKPDTGAPAWAMTTAARLTIRRGVTVGKHAGLYSMVSTEGAAEFDGQISIRNVTVSGENINNLSWRANMPLWSSGGGPTFGANFSIDVSNCIFDGPAPAANIRLPTGAENSAAWKVRDNIWPDAPYNIGSNSYATVALFQSAHNAAVGNLESAPLLSPTLEPLPNSPALDNGYDYGYLSDIEGKQGRKFIGAYASVRLRKKL